METYFFRLLKKYLLINILISIETQRCIEMAKKFTMSTPDSMYQALEKERKKIKLGTIQETIRFILAEYLKEKNN